MLTAMTFSRGKALPRPLPSFYVRKDLFTYIILPLKLMLLQRKITDHNSENGTAFIF
jgi:hypothetical protein